MEQGVQLYSRKASFPGTGGGPELGWGHSLPPWTSIALGMETYAWFKGAEEAGVTYSWFHLMELKQWVDVDFLGLDLTAVWIMAELVDSVLGGGWVQISVCSKARALLKCVLKALLVGELPWKPGLGAGEHRKHSAQISHVWWSGHRSEKALWKEVPVELDRVAVTCDCPVVWTSGEPSLFLSLVGGTRSYFHFERLCGGSNGSTETLMPLTAPPLRSPPTSWPRWSASKQSHSAQHVRL